MPKENTHLWFANGLLDYIPETTMIREISAHIGQYHLGSFIPDTFFYSTDASLELISEAIHGKDGKPTNEIIFRVLDEAKSMGDIAFILGYISHCALDITFHPMVNSLSGDYYDQNPLKKKEAVYLHRRFETCLDVSIQNPLRIYRLVRTEMIHGLAFEDIVGRIFSASPKDIRRILSRQLMANRIFASSPAYAGARLMYGLGLLKSKEFLSLFYGNIKGNDCIKEPIRYRDLSTGIEKVEPLSTLFTRARLKALGMIETAWGYAQGTVSGEHLKEMIPGENLSTGELPDYQKYA